MSTAPSRYLARLEADIAKATDPVARDCLRAERAACLARQGRFEEAEAVISELRSNDALTAREALAAWLNLAEGLNEYFANVQFTARDKFLRAQAISAFAGNSFLEGLSSAWIAQLDYSALKPESMLANLRRAFERSSQSDHVVRARACLVAAESLHYARRFDLARPWYERARIHASTDGDEPTLSAIMFNMAWLRMGAVRQALLCDESVGDELALARLGGESARSYDARIGSSSFNELDPLLQAETLSLANRHHEALDLYNEHLGQLRMIGADRWKCVFLADKAWSHVSVGQSEAAVEAAAAAETMLDKDVQVDDRASAHSWLSLTFAALGDQQRAASHKTEASRTWAEVSELQQRFVDLVSTLPSE